MAYTVLRAVDVEQGEGPHPAASAYDRRIGEALGVTAFEVYQVDLPAGAETVPHDHTDDDNDDVYVILEGSGVLIVDDERMPVAPGQYIAVEQPHRRQLIAGSEGLSFVAMCAPAHR